jgi:cytochrome c oxidase subunit IV
MAQADHSHGDHHHDEIAHVLPAKLLLGVWGALMFLTVVTVLATRLDFGPAINLTIAMAIATVKAGLVVAYFMHLRYDKLFHTVAFLSALLALILFVGFLVMDTAQYQHEIIWENPI